ncbi:hypothetical protein [Bacillus sp. ISL-57]|nr:hypothetical protein [Bacillus sp. ISL-57]
MKRGATLLPINWLAKDSLDAWQDGNGADFRKQLELLSGFV